MTTTECPDALVHLINDVRSDLPEITEVEILNPTITPEEMTEKHIVLDILALQHRNAGSAL